MKDFPFQTIQQYHSECLRRKTARRHLKQALLLCGSWFISALLAWGLQRWIDRAKPVPSVTIDGSALTGWTDRGDSELWVAWLNAARTATSLWEKEGVTVPSIRMFADPRGCPPDATACAYQEARAIYVVRMGADVDRTTIMMHEIGHVLGVPHIEGDPLMDKNYSKLCERPTPGAIALAKEEQMNQIRVFNYPR